MTPNSGGTTDTVIGALGTLVATCPWTQVLTGAEAVVAGALTIVLLCLRIRRVLNKP